MTSHEIKPLTSAAIGNAIDKANHYRLLNEPGVSESICRDILLADADHRQAQRVLLLSLTDMFDRGLGKRFDEAIRLAKAFPDSYERVYYLGIIYERRAKAHYRSGTPGCGALAYPWFEKAMAQFAKAEGLRAEGNDDAVLRWNNCVRRIQANPDLRPDHDPEEIAPQLGE